MKIWVVVGTRPEVIKQIPVYWACQERFGKDNVRLIGTGQHRELLLQALSHFGAKLHANFEIMQSGQSLSHLAAGVLTHFDNALASEKPDWVVVQGDTSTAAMAALASFHRKVKVAHNEAGLRSHDLHHPFPEEANRKIISCIADLHFAPTEAAKNCLLGEGVAPDRVLVVGNSGIDSLQWTLKKPIPETLVHRLASIAQSTSAPVLLTAHRRESAGRAMEQWFEILRDFFSAHPKLHLVYPLHPNNLGRASAEKLLASLTNVTLLEPLSYLETCHLLKACRFIVTDSGGLQEESASLGVPAVVYRKTTERREGVDAGRARLVDPDAPSTELMRALDWAIQQGPMGASSLYGDGGAAARIASALAK